MRLSHTRGCALGAVLVAAAAGCGSTGSGRNPLVWQKPRVLIPRDLPHDRIVVAHVRNSSSRTLHLDSRRIVVRDAGGRTLAASSRFTNSYAHGLFGAFQQPTPVPPAELTRLGITADLPPGASAPFFAAWRERPGSHEPARIDYGAGTLTVPRGGVRAP